MKFKQLKDLLNEDEPKNPGDIKQQQDIKKLVNYIKSHGHKVWEDGKEIKAIEKYTDKDGEAKEKEVTLKPNLKAVRNWLGY